MGPEGPAGAVGPEGPQGPAGPAFAGGTVNTLTVADPGDALILEPGSHLVAGGFIRSGSTQTRWVHEFEGPQALFSDNDLWFVRDSDDDDLDAEFLWLNDGGPATVGKTAMRLNPDNSLDVDGAVTPNGIDVAEYFPTVDTQLRPGLLVAVDPDHPEHVEMARAGTGQTVLGIVSTAPGVALGGDIDGLQPELLTAARQAAEEGHSEVASQLKRAWRELEMGRVDRALVALAGRVPVEVDLSGGPIAAGDRLGLGSEPGHAAKYAGHGPVVGIALDSFTGMGSKDSIVAFVKLETHPIVDAATAASIAPVRGSGAVPKGAAALTVYDSGVTAGAEVFVTFRGNPGTWHWVSQVAAGSFTVSFDGAVGDTVPFGYLVMP